MVGKYGHDEEKTAEIAQYILSHDHVVFFTGAGISTESGLPDYRGPQGVWTTGNIPRAGDLEYDEASRIDFWKRRREQYPFMQSRGPNEGHRAITEMTRTGHVLAVITQNIDGLHQKSGMPAERVVELHGSAHRLRCLENGHIMDGAEIQRRLEAGEVDPRCEICGSPLRSDTVLFDEPLPQNALELAVRVSMACDVFIVVGSSLVVNPAARLPAIARERGAKLIIIDCVVTPLDRVADIVTHSEAGPTLQAVAESVLARETP